MDFNYELKNLRERKRNLLYEGSNLKKAQIEELEEARKIISEKYQELFSEYYHNLDNINSEIYNHCKIYEKYSKFNLEDISNILASLMSIYERENFLVKYLSYQVDGALFNDILLIIKQKKYDSISSNLQIQERYINSLIKNRFAIKIISGFSQSKFPIEISFYEADSMGRINQKVNFRNYAYVQHFIEYVINYRIENGLEEISFDTLEMLKNNFIYCNLEQIKDYHSLLDENKRRSCEDFLEHDKKVAKRRIQKILKNRNQ